MLVDPFGPIQLDICLMTSRDHSNILQTGEGDGNVMLSFSLQRPQDYNTQIGIYKSPRTNSGHLGGLWQLVMGSTVYICVD
jgi:hypothetical protein